MKFDHNNKFITNRAWLRSAVGGEKLILRCTSALEYLQMFVGYINEQSIEVYAVEKGDYENFEYCVVDDFDNIDYFQHGNVLCSTLSQAVNDMLSDFENTDEQALCEALANYYYNNGNTFNGLSINPNNSQRFESVKEQAVNYYCGG